MTAGAASSSATGVAAVNDELRTARRIVVKVGSSLVTNEGREIGRAHV